MEILKERKYYLASLVLCWADNGPNQREEKSFSAAAQMLQGCWTWVQLTQENQLAARVALLLALRTSRKDVLARLRIRSRVSQASWGALWQKSSELCNLWLCFFSNFFPLKVTCLNWAMQLCVGGVPLLRGLRSDGCRVHYFFLHPGPVKL